MNTENQPIIAIDRSGSTTGSNIYWEKVKEYLDSLEDKNTICILWSTGDPKITTAKTFLNYFTNKSIPTGEIKGCTDPSTFVNQLPVNSAGIVLTLFTDGEIPDDDVKRCAKVLDEKNIHIKQLNTYLINPRQTINLSVIAPFLRRERNPINGDLFYTEFLQDLTTRSNKDGVSRKKREFGKLSEKIKNCSDLKHFLSSAEEIFSEIQLQNLYRSEDDHGDYIKSIIAQLTDLKINLFHFNLEEQSTALEPTIQKIAHCLKESSSLENTVDQTEKINEELQQLINNYYSDSESNQAKNLTEVSIKEILEKKISIADKAEQIFLKCFITISPKNGYLLNKNISRNQNTLTSTTERIEIEQLKIDELEEETRSKEAALSQSFVCPITLDKDIPILGIKDQFQESQSKPKYSVPLSHSTIENLLLKEFCCQAFSSKRSSLVKFSQEKFQTDDPSDQQIKNLLEDLEFKRTAKALFSNDRYDRKSVQLYKKDLKSETLNLLLNKFDFIQRMIEIFSDKQYENKLIPLDRSELKRRLEIIMVLFEKAKDIQEIVHKEDKSTLKKDLEACLEKINYEYKPWAEEYTKKLLKFDKNSIEKELNILLKEFNFIEEAYNLLQKENPEEKLENANFKIIEFILSKYSEEREKIEKEAMKEGSVQNAILKRAAIHLKRTILDNPLILLAYPDLVTIIKNRLAKPIGLSSICSMLENSENNSSKPRFKSPEREYISSFISLSDEPTHVQSTDYALDDLFFGGEGLRGDAILWLNVLYLIAKNCPWLDEIDEIDEIKQVSFLSLLKENVTDQLYKQETYLTLSSLLEDGPIVKVPIAVALWYCSQSPHLKTPDGYYLPNRLREAVTKFHLDLLDTLNLPYDGAWTRHQLARYKMADWMLAQSQTNARDLDKWCRSLYQNSINYHGEIILIDGSPSESDKPLKVTVFENGKKDINIPTVILYKDINEKMKQEGRCYIDSLSVEEVLTIYQLVCKRLDDVQKGLKKLKDPIIHNDFSPLKSIPEAKVNYSQGENEKDYETKICPTTLRPYTRDRSSDKPWEDAAKERFGPLNEQVSLNRYFNHYVKNKKEIPSKAKFIVYIEEKQRSKGVQSSKKDTLPQCILSHVDQLFESYRSAFIELFSLISLEDLYKIVDKVTINKEEKTIYKSEIEVNYKKAKEIYDGKKDFDLTDMPIALFNRLSEFSLKSIKREDIETVYFENEKISKVKDNSIFNLSKPKFFGQATITQKSEGNGSNDETMIQMTPSSLRS